MTDRTYLDYNASAPLLDCARDALVELSGLEGNASSVHLEGREARKHIEKSRIEIASCLDCAPANVIFSSGATEAASHALAGGLKINEIIVPVGRLIVSSCEHPCVLQGGHIKEQLISVLPVTEDGLVDLVALEQMVGEHKPAHGALIVAVQHANNETGVLQPVYDVSEVVHAVGGYLLVDAVQTFGRIPFSLYDLGADFLIASSHKIGGPKGAGALVLAKGNVSPVPLVRGGGQENYHRGGTENVAAIAGFSAACTWQKENMTKNLKISSLRDSIEEGISTISLEAGNEIAQPTFFGKGVERLPNTSCFSVAGVRAETALVALDLDGIAVSSGSACSSGKVKQSHVLAAMGASLENMEAALRVSLGWNSSEECAQHFLAAWKTIVGRKAA